MSNLVVRRITTVQTPESWAVLEQSGEVVEPIDRFLSHLEAVGKSPNTIRAYAFDLRDLFTYLTSRGRANEWDRVSVEDMGDFVVWLRHGDAMHGDVVRPHPSRADVRSVATIRRKLAAASSFYDFHLRTGAPIDAHLWRTVRGGWRRGEVSFKPLLTHLGAREQREFAVKVRNERHHPSTLSDREIEMVIDSTGTRRDRLFMQLLAETGIRAGEALGLRHEDIDIASCTISVKRRMNTNGARAKTRERQLPTSAGLARLYSDYLHEEYGPWDNDFVFINLTGRTAGSAWTYNSLNALVRRLRRETGLNFTAHTLRHSFATALLRRGVRVEVVQYLMGHASFATTSDTYAHLGAEDARRVLEDVGWFGESVGSAR